MRNPLVPALVAVLLVFDITAAELSGRIVQDDSNSPVPSALLRIQNTRGSDLAEIETDAEGRFRVSLPGPGKYRLLAEKAGYLDARMAVEAAAGARVTVRLVRLGAVTGRVTDHAGKPVRSARVLAMAGTPGGVPRPLPQTPGAAAAVDDTGRYRLYNLPPGEYAVVVSSRAPAVPPAFVTIAGGDEHRGVDFTLLPGALYLISGSVELPKPGARFGVALVPAGQPAAAIATTWTTPEGGFRFDGVPSGSYHLLASGPIAGRAFHGWMLASDPMFGRARVDVAGADAAGVAIAVGTGRRAAIRLSAARGAESACRPAAPVALTSLEDWGALLDRSVDAAFDMDAAVPGLAPARYLLTASRLGGNCFQTSDAVLDLTGPESTAAVPLAPAGSVRGRLTGAGASECAVVLLPSGRNAVHLATPGEDGRFTFDSLPPGRYRIAVRRDARPAAGEPWLLDLDIPGGVPTEVELPAPPPGA